MNNWLGLDGPKRGGDAAFLLLRLAHAAQNAVHRPIDFVRLVRLNLMQRRRIDRLLEPPPIPPTPNQFSLALNS